MIFALSGAKVGPSNHDVHHAFLADEDEYEHAKRQLLEYVGEIFFEED